MLKSYYTERTTYLPQPATMTTSIKQAHRTIHNYLSEQTEIQLSNVEI